MSGLGIVNLGLPVTGSHSHYLVLNDYAQHFKPPLVIWQFYGNDFNDDYGLFSANGSIAPLEEGRDADDEPVDEGSIVGWLRMNSALFTVAETILTGRRRFVDPDAQQFEERYALTLSGGERLRFGQTYEPRAMDMTRAVNQAGYHISRSAFESALDLTASWGGQFVVVLLPAREEVYEAWTASEMGDELEAISSARFAMREICAALDLLCYDALEDLQAQASDGDLLYYEDDLHLNPRGNRILADLVSEWLAEQDLLPS